MSCWFCRFNISVLGLLAWNWKKSNHKSLRKKCPNSKFFSSVFSCDQIEYEHIHIKFPYSVQIRKNTDERNSHNSRGGVFESIIISPGEFIFVGKLRNDNFLWKLYCSSTNFNVFVFQSQFHAYCLVWAFRKAIRRSSAFPPFYRDFYRLLFAASKVTRYQACYLFFKLIKHVLVTLATAFNDNF